MDEIANTTPSSVEDRGPGDRPVAARHDLIEQSFGSVFLICLPVYDSEQSDVGQGSDPDRSLAPP
jgi:hypothetical protein